MVIRIVLIFLSVTSIGCSGRHTETAGRNDSFRIPAIKIPVVNRDLPEARHLYPISDSMESSLAIFAGKFKFSDSISLSNYDDTLLQNDIVDFSVLDKYKDSMSSDGLQVIADYKTTITDTTKPLPEEKLFGNAYYPVFIVNESSSSRLFDAVSSKVHALQEAKDSNGVWRPIESAPELDWCGNSYWGLLVHPKELVTILLAKHQGSYKTQLRVRARIGNCVYVSAPFDGSINYNKFYMKWWSYEHAYLVVDEPATLIREFYGSNVLYNRNSKAERAYKALAVTKKK